MSIMNVEALDHTVERTNRMLKDIMQELNWDDKHAAYLALRATLHALRDRLMPQEAIHFGAQLPLLVRGIYYEGWSIKDRPLVIRDKEEFLGMVKDNFSNDGIQPERVFTSVINVLSQYVDEGQMRQIKNQMPKDIQQMFPSAY